MTNKLYQRISSFSAALLLALSSVAALPIAPAYAAEVPALGTPINKVNVCHRDDSTTKPYVSQEIAVSAAVNREANIVNGAIGVFPTTPWGDIIPPFTYKDGDEIKSFEGLNWNLAGQATYHNGCVTPAEKVSPTITPVVVCGPNNDTYTTTDYDAAIMTKTESLWVNNSKSITFSMSTSAYTFADYATSFTLTLVDAATQCIADETPVITPCTQSAGTTLVAQYKQFADYTYQDTRATGHYEFTADGLHIWTDGETSTDKVALYKSVTPYALSQVGVPSMSYSSNFGLSPGLQIVVDLNNDGTADGILVGEPNAYGSNWWASASIVENAGAFPGLPRVGGGGSAINGTLDQYLAAYPQAKVMTVGFSLGSGVYADGVLHSLTFGCYTWTFGKDATPPTPCTVKNNTYIQPWTFDKYQYPEADAWPTGTAGTYTFTSDGLTLSTPSEESYVSGLIDAGATPLRDIDTMKYKTLRQATSTGNAIQVAAYVLYVDLDGDIATTNDQTYYVYEPAYNGTVQTGVWQTWDVLQGGNSKWWGNGSGVPDQTWSAIVATHPAAVALAYGFNQGTSNPGINTLIQDLVFDCATTHFAAPGMGGGGNDSDTPDQEVPVAPAVVTPVTPGQALPQLLPHTGPSDTTSPQGLLLALIAAIATYGALYFAQGKRRFEQ